MLIFNCTKAASEALTRVHKGVKVSAVKAPPNKLIEEGNQLEAGGEPVFQWVVHAIKTKHKTVLVAMDVEHRFCLFIPPINKGDSDGFYDSFLHLMMNHMHWIGEDLQLLNERNFQTIGENFSEIHQQKCFYLRSDRSVLGSMKEAIWAFEELVEELGRVPDAEHELGSFNAWVNDQLRRNKLRKDYFYPDQSLFLDWYATYFHATPAMVKEARERFEERRRSVFADVLNRKAEEQVVIPEDELPDNVILLDNYR